MVDCYWFTHSENITTTIGSQDSNNSGMKSFLDPTRYSCFLGHKRIRVNALMGKRRIRVNALMGKRRKHVEDVREAIGFHLAAQGSNPGHAAFPTCADPLFYLCGLFSYVCGVFL